MTIKETMRVVSIRQASEMVGCCYHTVWRAVAGGELPSTRRGPRGYHHIRVADLLAWNQSGPHEE